MDRVEQILQELANQADVTIMTLEEFLDILTSNIGDDSGDQLTLDLDEDILN